MSNPKQEVVSMLTEIAREDYETLCWYVEQYVDRMTTNEVNQEFIDSDFGVNEHDINSDY